MAVPTADLLSQLRRREHRAQRQIYVVHRAWLEALATKILSCPAEARPLVADVMTDFMYRYVDTLKREQAIPAYLRMMTTRRARRHNLRQQRTQVVDDQELAMAPELANPGDGSRWQRWVDDCLATLADKPRRFLRLHFGHDLSLSAIGSQTGVTKQAVSKTVQKGLALMRRCLQSKGALIDGQ